METQILEGTFKEVKRRLSALPLKPDARLRVIVTEPETGNESVAAPFTPTEFRNGVPLLPRRKLNEPIALELVKRLSEDDDEEIIGAYRAARR